MLNLDYMKNLFKLKLKSLTSLLFKKIIFLILLIVIIIYGFLFFSQPQVSAVVPLPPDAFVNVKDFGAKGDGITDDTSAIQRAINDSSSRRLRLVFPASETYYLVTSQLTLRSIPILVDTERLFLCQLSPLRQILET